MSNSGTNIADENSQKCTQKSDVFYADSTAIAIDPTQKTRQTQNDNTDRSIRNKNFCRHRGNKITGNRWETYQSKRPPLRCRNIKKCCVKAKGEKKGREW